jgi:hypothetical protein
MPRFARVNCVVVVLLVGLLVTLALVVVTILTTSSGFDAKQSKAELGCKGIAWAIEDYVNHPSNTKQEFPRTLTDLVQPAWGGPSFLNNGFADLIDPWGEPYQTERVRGRDGAEYILVKTTAPDGTPISQFGIGKNLAFPSH